MLEIIETKKGVITFKKTSRIFRTNHSVESKLHQRKEPYKNFRVDKRPI